MPQVQRFDLLKRMLIFPNKMTLVFVYIKLKLFLRKLNLSFCMWLHAPVDAKAGGVPPLCKKPKVLQVTE
jgi:hypothetical protein